MQKIDLLGSKTLHLGVLLLLFFVALTVYFANENISLRKDIENIKSNGRNLTSREGNEILQTPVQVLKDLKAANKETPEKSKPVEVLMMGATPLTNIEVKLNTGVADKFVLDLRQRQELNAEVNNQRSQSGLATERPQQQEAFLQAIRELHKDNSSKSTSNVSDTSSPFR
jgi:sucrose-6-phosphate hydrolase SacC (GH32 family)